MPRAPHFGFLGRDRRRCVTIANGVESADVPRTKKMLSPGRT
jgi:hypothetical protein